MEDDASLEYQKCSKLRAKRAFLGSCDILDAIFHIFPVKDYK